MTFDEWWKSKDDRFRAAMLKEDMREVWAAACEECAKVCEVYGSLMHGGGLEDCEAFDCADAIRESNTIL